MSLNSFYYKRIFKISGYIKILVIFMIVQAIALMVVGVLDLDVYNQLQSIHKGGYEQIQIHGYEEYLEGQDVYLVSSQDLMANLSNGKAPTFATCELYFRGEKRRYSQDILVNQEMLIEERMNSNPEECAYVSYDLAQVLRVKLGDVVCLRDSNTSRNIELIVQGILRPKKSYLTDQIENGANHVAIVHTKEIDIREISGVLVQFTREEDTSIENRLSKVEEFRQYCKYELEERLPFMYMINGFAGLIFIASILVLNVQQYNEQRRNFIILRQMGSGKRELAIGFFLNMCMFTLLMVMGAVMMARYGLVRWSQKYLDITLLVKIIVSLGAVTILINALLAIILIYWFLKYEKNYKRKKNE